MSDDKTKNNGQAELADLATIGAQIVELGVKLKSLKAERATLDLEITTIETELMPLVAKHAKIIAAITGVALQPAKRAPAAAPTSAPAGAGASTPANVAKNRVKDFIKTRAQEGMSALDIADVLKVDASLVRECMNEIIHARRGGGAPG